MKHSPLFVLLASLALASAQPASADSTSRETVVSQGLSADGKTAKGKAQLTAPTSKPLDRGNYDRNARKGASPVSESVNQDFWIYDADTALFDDFDADGFYTRLELSFDADTVFDGANVFAVLYLSLEGGDWIEYGETAVFDIYGTSGNDEYYFDSDLVSGFPTGYYDVLIELYDDFDGRLVAVFGPEQSLELFDLPLESQVADTVLDPVIVVTEEGGGSIGLVTSLALVLALLARVAIRQRFGVTNKLAIKPSRLV
ncbi:MAG: choice-of-anchor H family protein [Pseudomonadota bacterium]